MKNKTISIFLLLTIVILTGCGGIGGMGVMPGRPLRVKGQSIAAPIDNTQKNQWAKGEHPNLTSLDEATRLALAALWLDDARGEHASIPAFSRISWQLAMIGAPPHLLEWAHEAALEEITHAQLCFALAEGYGKESYSVRSISELQQGGLDITEEPIALIAKETLLDGCLMEGFFAKVTTEAAVHCEEPVPLAVLEKIAKEEKSHADFSWALLVWLLENHPDIVQPIVKNVLTDFATLRRPHAIKKEYISIVEAANPELLVKHGRLPDEAWQKIWNHHLIALEESLQMLLRNCR